MKIHSAHTLCCLLMPILAACARQGQGADAGGAMVPPGEGDGVVANLCDLVRGSTLLVEAQIVSVGSPNTAQQVGLAPIENATLLFEPSLPVESLTLEIVATEFGAQPSAEMPVLFQSDRAPFGPDGGPATRGYFFLTQYAGRWVVLNGGFFTWDANGMLWNGNEFARRSEISEADFLGKVAADRQSTAPCWTPVCPGTGGVVTDAGTCVYPCGANGVLTDAGTCVFPDGGPGPTSSPGDAG